MDKQELKGSTIGIVAVIILTVNPVSQIILLTINGGLAYIFALPFDASTKLGVVEQTALILNSFLTILGLLAFYISIKIWKTVLSTFLIMFSGQGIMIFVSDEFIGGDDYLLGWLTVSGIPTSAILTLGILKYYSRKKFIKINS